MPDSNRNMPLIDTGLQVSDKSLSVSVSVNVPVCERNLTEKKRSVSFSLTGFLYVVLISLSFIFIALTVTPLKAQYYSLGNDPARLKWKQISFDGWKVIYPQEADSMARVYAALIESSYRHVQKPLKVQSRPVPVVLHPYSVYSNGVVTWAPGRVEMITTPPVSMSYSQMWDRQLVVHELRHVAQISKFEHGVFKPLSWLIGEQAAGLGVGLYLDKFTLEGDAVISETEFSSSGRGRDPSFLMFYKAAFLEGDTRNLERWKLGSGKKYTPDYYSLGYFIHSHIRTKTANRDYIGEISESKIKNFYNPLVSRIAYRKVTGKTLEKHFDQIKRESLSIWSREDSARAPFTNYKIHSKSGRDYVSYTNVVAVTPDVATVTPGVVSTTPNVVAVTPGVVSATPNVVAITPDGAAVTPDYLYAVKWDMHEPSRLVLLGGNGKGEKRVTSLGHINGSPVAKGGKIFWTEKVPSIRWELESYSVLKCFDAKTGKVTKLTKRGVLCSPAFSSGGDTLAMAEYPATGGSLLQLFIFDSGNMEKISSFPAPDNGQIKEALFMGRKIYASVITKEGIALFALEPASGEWSRETPLHRRSINRLGRFGEYLVFESDLNGTNNIYGYNPALKSLHRLTNSRFGAFQPYPSGDGSRLYYSDFDRSGYKIVSVTKDSLLWEQASFLTTVPDPAADMMSRESGFSIDTVSLDTEKYEPQNYKKLSHLFRIHSWAPFYYNIDKLKNISYDNFYEILSPGLTLYSQNTLGTMTGMAAYSYSNKRHAGHINLSYSGFWPVIEIQADYNEANSNYIRLARDMNGRKYQFITPVEGTSGFSSRVMLYLPMNFGGGGWSKGLTPTFLWRYSNDSYYSYEKTKYLPYQYISAGLQFYKIRNVAPLDIYPRLGIGVNLQFNKVPFSGENYGSLFFARVYGYLPGISGTHGLKLSLSYQHQNYTGKNYLLPNVASSPRGYEKKYGKNYVSFSADYAFPVYLGDLNILSLLYLKRLNVMPFADWAYNQGERSDSRMFSFGTDLLVDFNAIGISIPLSAGVRYIRTDRKQNHYQFLFTIPL